MILTASVYDRRPRSGARVLVTRYWPRGFRKEAFDMWMRDLAPSATLLKRYHSGLPWAEFERLYRVEMESEAAGRALDKLRGLAKDGDVVLLCYEPDGENCHRNILLDMLGGVITNPAATNRRGN